VVVVVVMLVVVVKVGGGQPLIYTEIGNFIHKTSALSHSISLFFEKNIFTRFKYRNCGNFSNLQLNLSTVSTFYQILIKAGNR